MSFTVHTSRARFSSLLLLAVAVLSFFGFSSATPIRSRSIITSLHQARDTGGVPPGDAFTQENVIKAIRDKVGRNGYMFYQSPQEADSKADIGRPGYWSFQQIYSEDMLGKIGNPDKNQTDVLMRMATFMVEAARGDIGLVGADAPKAGSYWVKYERPILQANMAKGKITAIRYYVPGEQDISNYWAYETYDKDTKSVVRRTNPKYKSPSSCKRSGSCMTTDAATKVVDTMNKADQQSPPKLPTDVPNLQAALDDDYTPEYNGSKAPDVDPVTDTMAFRGTALEKPDTQTN